MFRFATVQDQQADEAARPAADNRPGQRGEQRPATVDAGQPDRVARQTAVVSPRGHRPGDHRVGARHQFNAQLCRR